MLFFGAAPTSLIRNGNTGSIYVTYLDQISSPTRRPPVVLPGIALANARVALLGSSANNQRIMSPRLLTATAALLSALALSRAADPAPVSPWISLFNGRNLEGWTVKITGHALGDNYAETFRVRDGVLCVSYDKYQRFEAKFGHLFYREKLSNYVLRVEYRFLGEQTPGGPSWAFRNSGIMIHSQAPETMERDQEFPVG